MSEELKPCPFCGGEAIIRIHKERSSMFEYLGYGENAACVACTKCGCNTGYYLPHYDQDENYHIKQATKAWNRRAT